MKKNKNFNQAIGVHNAYIRLHMSILLEKHILKKSKLIHPNAFDKDSTYGHLSFKKI